MTLAEILKSPPKIHKWTEGELTSSGLPEEVFGFMDKMLTKDSTSIETGMGISTALFGVKECKHICVNPDKEEIARFVQYATLNGINLNNMTFIAKRSDEVWFDLKNTRWDFVLVDGCHGFPVAFMDWYFLCNGLAINGYVVIDDTHLFTGRVLKDFLKAEEEWKLVEPFSDKTAIFQKIKDFNFNKEWNQQAYTLQSTKLLNKGNRFNEFAKKIKKMIGL